MIGARPFDGSSIRRRRFGFTSARGDGEHLLLSAGERAGPCVAEALEVGKEREDAVEALARRGVVDEPGHAQVLVHREGREDALAFRHVADPEAGDGVRGQAMDRPSLEPDRTPAGVKEAHHGAEGRRLAGPVPAEEDSDRVRSHVERDALEDVVLADVGVDVLDLEEGGHVRVPPPPK